MILQVLMIQACQNSEVAALRAETGCTLSADMPAARIHDGTKNPFENDFYKLTFGKCIFQKIIF